MKKTLRELADLVDGSVIGDESVIITGVAGIKESSTGDITFISNPKYFKFLKTTKASAIIISDNLKDSLSGLSAIVSKNPYLAYAKIIMLIAEERKNHPSGISPHCIVEKTAKLGDNVSLSGFVFIDAYADIGEGTIIYPNCYIGKNVSLGRNCLIYSNVTIRENVKIGDNVIIHSGTVIGSDGFGYVTLPQGLKKIPQIGTVEICDDVEIGSNVSIDRATTGKTFIGKGTKIDNLVQIAHNVQIGENSVIVAQAGIAGSSKVGNWVTIAGQAGIVGHINIADGAVIAAQAGVIGDVGPKETVSGYPARPHRQAMRSYAFIQKLPELFEEMKNRKKEQSNGETKNNKK
ncbi:MAG: UDP-3-O-acylglucosamine N-acyltransferase [Elusimicrobia bacterium ADurb.Bin231]|nr:MAG: UDP-3-O-acylglucosamine N-acyltransferase [Elusimicrobia bacterium ADurb.Bin231]